MVLFLYILLGPTLNENIFITRDGKLVDLKKNISGNGFILQIYGNNHIIHI